MSKPVITYEVKYNQSYFRKTKGNTNKVRENLEKAGKDFMKTVHGKARQYAPRLTGEVVRHIHLSEVKSGRDSFVYQVYTTNPTEGGKNQMYANIKYSDFDLIRWMHSTGGKFRSDNPFGRAGTQHIPRDQARFMFRAKDYAIENSNRYINKKALKRGLIT